MRWLVRAERTLYRDRWIDVRTADVQLPDGRHLDHRIIHSAHGAYAVMVRRKRVLLIWRHRFITDTWGWEIPGGGIDGAEEPVEAAAREAEEETGWRPGRLRPLIQIQPMSGLLAARHHVFRADSARYLGPPTHGWESARIAWVPVRAVRGLLRRGEIVEGTSLVALLCLLARAERR